MIIKLNNMVLIGAADRNVGKTELACKLIEKYAESRNVIGLKVTTVKALDGKCPRGGKGCGVCSSLNGEYDISMETDKGLMKDTSKMLKAGAKRVYWLRALNSALEKGFEKLLSEIKSEFRDDFFIVCESNSLREVVKPGLFLVLNKEGNTLIKSSCKKVIQYADKCIKFFPELKKFDIDIEDIFPGKNTWYMKFNASAIILAGGESRRMGKDKTGLLISDKTIIQYIVDQVKPFFSQIIISSNDVKNYEDCQCRIVPDKMKGQGPLMGILSCLEQSDYEANFVLACDIPHVNMDYVRQMLVFAEKFDAVIPCRENGRLEPVFAIYNKSAINVLNDVMFEQKKRQIRVIFDKLKTKYIPFPENNWYYNLNTQDEYNDFLTRYKNNDLP